MYCRICLEPKEWTQKPKRYRNGKLAICNDPSLVCIVMGALDWDSKCKDCINDTHPPIPHEHNKYDDKSKGSYYHDKEDFTICYECLIKLPKCEFKIAQYSDEGKWLGDINVFKPIRSTTLDGNPKCTLEIEHWCSTPYLLGG